MNMYLSCSALVVLVLLLRTSRARVQKSTPVGWSRGPCVNARLAIEDWNLQRSIRLGVLVSVMKDQRRHICLMIKVKGTSAHSRTRAVLAHPPTSFSAKIHQLHRRPGGAAPTKPHHKRQTHQSCIIRQTVGPCRRWHSAARQIYPR